MNTAEIIATLHAGLLDGAAWRMALATLADAVRAHHLIAVVTGPARAARPTIAIWGARLTPRQLHGFASFGSDLLSMTACMRVGQAVPGDAVVPDAVLHPSRLWHEVIRPVGGHHCAVARPFGEGFVAACRSEAAGRFSDREVGELQAVLPALATALRLKRRLDLLDERTRMLEDALDAVETATFLLDRHGAVVHLNRAAERIITAADGLYCKEGMLAGARDADTIRLRRTIGEATGSPCALARPSLRRPLLVRAVAINGRMLGERGGPGAARTLLFVRDPAREDATGFDRIAGALGLTPREAQLAARFADGMSVAAAAEAVGITVGNARIHLKRIFDKTDTHRQAELVRLLFKAKL